MVFNREDSVTEDALICVGNGSQEGVEFETFSLFVPIPVCEVKSIVCRGGAPEMYLGLTVELQTPADSDTAQATE